jgi:nucleoid-associated protein YgaU
MTLICPVCETQNEGNQRCKQCSTDLGPLIRVAALPLEYYQDGLDLLERGRLEAAMEKLSAAASLDPDSADIQVALGRTCQRQGLHEAAVAHFDRASKLAQDRQDIRDMRTAAVGAESQRTAAEVGKAMRASRLRRLVWALPAAAFLLGLVTLAGIQWAPRLFTAPPDPVAGVRARLQANPATRGLALRVSEDAGLVEVAGEAPSELHVQLIRAVAAQGFGGRVDFAGLKVARPPAPPEVTYRVRAGDSLWLIARKKYGNGALWPYIEKANPGRPRELSVGDSLTLPAVALQPR